MKYFIGLALLLACLVSGLVGLTIGMNLNSESTTKYVLNWGSLGDWVAGAGAFFAVGVALWQAHQMRKDDIEKLKITQRQLPGRWVISIVSCGRRPSRVLDVAFYSAKTSTTLPIKSFIFNSNRVQYPVTLNYSENVDIVSGPGCLIDLAQAALYTFLGDLSDLELKVQTTLEDFKVPVNPDTKIALVNASQQFFMKAREEVGKS